MRKNTRLTRQILLNVLGCVLLVLAAALLVLTFLMQNGDIAGVYDELLARLAEFEAAVASIPSKGLVLLVILALYAGKTVIPLPISAVCVIAGMVFPTAYAVLINTAGFILLATLKYLWGKHLGGGAIHKLLTRYDNVRQLIESGSRSIDGLLILLRLVPSFPVNTVSQFCGAMQLEYVKFLLLSLLGFAPKIVSYSMIGRHVYNPFSLAFMLPLVILLTISGVSLLGINLFFGLIDKNKSRSKKKSN